MKLLLTMQKSELNDLELVLTRSIIISLVCIRYRQSVNHKLIDCRLCFASWWSSDQVPVRPTWSIVCCEKLLMLTRSAWFFFIYYISSTPRICSLWRSLCPLQPPYYPTVEVPVPGVVPLWLLAHYPPAQHPCWALGFEVISVVSPCQTGGRQGTLYTLQQTNKQHPKVTKCNWWKRC